MGYDARTTDYAALSTPQRLALVDMVSRGGLYRNDAGYDGTLTHRHTTMVALDKRGLCKIRPASGDMGAVDPTKRGVAVIISEFQGEKPLLVDCDAFGRRRRRD